MRKFSSVIFLILFCGSTSFAQFSLNSAHFNSNIYSNSFEKGDLVIHSGYGFPNLVGSVFSIFEDKPSFSSESTAPFHFDLEFGIANKLGLGLSVNSLRANANWIYNNGTFDFNEGADYTAITFNIRMNYHFLENEKLDVYWGVGAGYGYRKVKLRSDFDVDLLNDIKFKLPPIGLESTIGLRYFPIRNIGVYAELGLAKSIIQVGLVAKINTLDF